MLKILICYIQTIHFLKTTSSQYHHGGIQNQYGNPYQIHYRYQPNFYPQQEPEYQNHQVNHRQPKSRKCKTCRSNRYHADFGDDYANDDLNECQCSCSDCDNPKPCCSYMCSTNCSPQTALTNLVYVPYPVAIMMKPNSKREGPPNSTSSTSTTSASTNISSSSSTTTSIDAKTTTETTTTVETKSTSPPLVHTTSISTPDPTIHEHHDNMESDTLSGRRGTEPKHKYLLVSLRGKIEADGKPNYGIMVVPEKISKQYIPKRGSRGRRRSVYKKNMIYDDYDSWADDF